MSNGWSPEEQKKLANASVVASQTNFPISKEFKVTAGGALHMVACVDIASFSGTVTLKLQTSNDSLAWFDVKSTAAIAATGPAYIRLLCEATADQPFLPLLGKCRVVATTAAASSLVVNSVQILQAK